MGIRMIGFNNKLEAIILATLAVVLRSCAATQTALEHGSLQVSTKQSETIFLDPVSSAQKTVYVSVKNTSDEEIDIAPQLKTALSSHGYKVINNPNAAHYLLQANVLKVGKMSIAASQSALGGGYGSAIAGAVVGTAAGRSTLRAGRGCRTRPSTRRRRAGARSASCRAAAPGRRSRRRARASVRACCQ